MTTTIATIRRAALALSLIPAAAAAQGDRSCRPHPSLGITGISCQNCTISRSGESRNWASFSTEPRILAVAPDGTAAGVLRAGDVIVAVDGHLITTRDGGDAFVGFDVGDEVRLRVRRDGRERDVVVTAEARCAPMPPAPPAPEPVPLVSRAPRAATPPAPAPAPEPRAVPAPRAQEPPPAPEPPAQVAGRMWRYSRGLPRLGMSLSCSDCTLRMDDEEGSVWEFEQWPEVLSVERGSPADAAGFRAGDILVRIDGLDLRTPEGGRHFGQVRPGDRLQWDIVRDGVMRTLRHRLADAPSPPTPAAPAAPSAPSAPAPPGPVRAVTRIGDVDVEVRGDPAVVLEDDGVMVIRAGGVEVRLSLRPTPGPSGG